MAAADPRRSRSERKLMSSTESAASIPAVELSGLGVTYGGPTGREVLRGIDLSIAPGEIVCIVGHSGIGKSTLIRCIRSEEHTSELQSLMRISSAVICLKK